MEEEADGIGVGGKGVACGWSGLAIAVDDVLVAEGGKIEGNKAKSSSESPSILLKRL